ncbi:MAG: hypothetical protein ABW087_04940 [Candidatus Thiodiazotropha sp.]
MRLHRICGVRFRSHLRSYARAYAYRGLTAFASLSMAVSGGEVWPIHGPVYRIPRLHQRWFAFY